MKFFANINKKEIEFHRIYAQKVGLIYEEREDAYDIWGELLPEHVAIFIPKSLRQDEAINGYMKIGNKINREYHKIFAAHGIPIKDLIRIIAYPGCEKEYFPHLVGKINFDLDKFLEEIEI